jgi:pyruvate dehydrogenase E2 component (dihydrolipoamide acetyltransferase)
VGIAPVPDVDFSQFGEIDVQPRSRLDKLTAQNMSRAWLNVPHVTQFDDADITELEAFRQSLKAEAEKRGTKLSPLPFILKACAVALEANPKLKSSLADSGDTLVSKHYCHIGMAVDTPAGLMVPVLRDVDKKTVWELAEEVLELAGLARDRKLRPEQMQGGVFSVSSLGNIGGRGFTPIVNAPEVAILGVSRASIQPVWDGQAFAPRTLLPLSLSYDHRVINGGDAGRFLTQLVGLLADIRRCLL